MVMVVMVWCFFDMVWRLKVGFGEGRVFWIRFVVWLEEFMRKPENQEVIFCAKRINQVTPLIWIAIAGGRFYSDSCLNLGLILDHFGAKTALSCSDTLILFGVWFYRPHLIFPVLQSLNGCWLIFTGDFHGTTPAWFVRTNVIESRLEKLGALRKSSIISQLSMYWFKEDLQETNGNHT
jgi:hypothetical protein